MRDETDTSSGESAEAGTEGAGEEDQGSDVESDTLSGRQETWVEWLKRTAGVLDVEIKKGAVTDWVDEQKRRKWCWAGHLARRTDWRWTVRMLHWIPRGGTRWRGRPVTRWEDELGGFVREEGFTLKWDKLAQDRDLWGSMEDKFAQYGVA